VAVVLLGYFGEVPGRAAVVGDVFLTRTAKQLKSERGPREILQFALAIQMFEEGGQRVDSVVLLGDQ